MKLLIGLLVALVLGLVGCESCNGAAKDAEPEAKADEALAAPAEVPAEEAEDVVPENSGVSK